MLYKLTNSKKMTANNTLWGSNTTHHAKKGKPVLCTDTVIHAYQSVIHAIIYNPIHARFDKPLLWEAKGEVVISDNTKVGCKSLTTLQLVDLPEISLIQRITFAILCVKSVYRDEKWNEWADNWLNDKDRSSDTAYAAYASNVAAHAAAHAAASNVAASATAASDVAHAASNVAASAAAAYASNASAFNAAAFNAAAHAASAAADASKQLDLLLIWDSVMKLGNRK